MTLSINACLVTGCLKLRITCTQSTTSSSSAAVSRVGLPTLRGSSPACLPFW
eukprot:CAMPEP_0180306330 /NCGR_PEP_ID=MMETSP0988-20121125/26999_1 /TAXON_ID=697907 /ORGANISM="non described non described, Strain CCMP2293" /LENGTH=51 /DNA_ID=CAMNT_0022289017 /DNA_START=40 /DNA_END=192 /DNA_ORIENTATION=+